MGSAGPSLADGKEEVNVLVTGFGVRSPPVLSPKPFIDKKTFQPFGNNRINPSHLIASSLPSSFKTKELPTINIVKASPIPVIYRTVRELVPKLSFPNASSSSANAPSGAESGADHPALPFQDLLTADTSAKNKPRYDFVLHIGMAPPRKFFTMETRAHRDGYKARDEDGETMEVDHFWASKYDAPGVLKTGFDTTDVWRRWKSELMVGRHALHGKNSVLRTDRPTPKKKKRSILIEE